jgi:hypothetical protein
LEADELLRGQRDIISKMKNASRDMGDDGDGEQSLAFAFHSESYHTLTESGPFLSHRSQQNNIYYQSIIPRPRHINSPK